MTREQAKKEVKERYAEYLRPAKKKGTYICPLCQNGTGTTGDGLSVDPHSDRLHLKCYKCGFYGDVIELYQQEHGCTQQEAFSGLYSLFNIQIDDYTAPTEKTPQRAQDEPQGASFEEAKDYTEYYKECRARLTEPAALEYLSFRGISQETAASFWLGYDPQWKSPAAIANGKNAPSSPRLIIPTSASSYIARDTRQEVPDAAKAFQKMKEGSTRLFNVKALRNETNSPVFITEGEIDALSIIEAGAEAAALGSTSNTGKLIKELQANPTSCTLVLCLDNDEAGKKAENELAEGLQGLNIAYIRADVCGSYKDPNEALTADRGAFISRINEAIQKNATKPDSIKDYLGRIFAGEIEKFKQDSTRKTGFANLDALAGGLYPGLYAIGAISSLGKTTFIHQIADQMAAAGNHILYFSLEQSRFEMASKSLARLTAKQEIKSAVSSLDIRKGKITPEVQKAYKVYAETVGDRLSVIEGNFNCNVSFIGEYVTRYIKQNNVKPVVIIDYLQILDGIADQKQNTRDIVDTNVRELKRMSRNNDIPVIVISSLNRSNYLTPVDFESFKESGGIEYTCDVLWGLQLAVMEDDLFNKQNEIKKKREKVKEAKAATPRTIQLVCLKNRYGISSYTTDFLYYPANDLFIAAAPEWREEPAARSGNR